MREKPITTQLFDKDKTGEDDLGLNPSISGAWVIIPMMIRKADGILEALMRKALNLLFWQERI